MLKTKCNAKHEYRVGRVDDSYTVNKNIRTYFTTYLDWVLIDKTVTVSENAYIDYVIQLYYCSTLSVVLDSSLTYLLQCTASIIDKF